MKKIMLIVMFSSALVLNAACSNGEGKKEVSTDSSKIEQLESRVKELETSSTTEEQKKGDFKFGEPFNNDGYIITVKEPENNEDKSIKINVELNNEYGSSMYFSGEVLIVKDSKGEPAILDVENSPVETLAENEQKSSYAIFKTENDGPYTVEFNGKTWK